MTQEQLLALSHFLNASPSLPADIQEIADALKEELTPIVEKKTKKTK